MNSNPSDFPRDGKPVDDSIDSINSIIPNQQDSGHADAVTPDDGLGFDSDQLAGAPSPELVGLEEQIAFLLRADCHVDAPKSVSIAASVFEASLPSLPARTLPITTGQASPWARPIAVASGFAAAACVAMVAWIGTRPALIEREPQVGEMRVTTVSDQSGIFVASMGESRDSEALLAVVLGGEGDWLDEASSTTIAFRDVRPVMNSWSLEVDDLEDEIRSILERPAS